MAIAPIEGTTPERADPGLRVIAGGRRPDAPARGAALHARDGRAEALRRSRAAHPTAVTRVDRALAPVADPAVLPVGSPWEDPSRVRSPVASRQPAARDQGAVRTRGHVRAKTLARRRRTMAIGVVLVAVVLLAMPLRALGAVTVAGQPTPAGVPAGLAPGSIYVVQDGDTLRSIAMRVNAVAAAAIERELATSIGSSHVVVGEHVTIP
jgi:hypothetical protein